MKKLCKSCSGPLDEYKKEDLKNPDYCPYCVDEKGDLRSFADIFDGMINYIKSDHPEVEVKKRSKQARDWLVEGPIWGEKWRGCIVEESLEDRSLLDLVKIEKTKVSEDKDPATNGGFPVWHIHEVSFPRADLQKLVESLKKALKKAGWWCDLSGKEDICIVFRGKVFELKRNDRKAKSEVNKYARSVSVPEDQLPFSKDELISEKIKWEK
jgi:hypothetical protein